MPYVIASDGTYLGDLGCSSIGNPASRFGSEVGATSIWNVVSRYGSVVSEQSAWNPVTPRPPIIMLDGKPIGFLTVNPILITRAIDPRRLEAFMIDRCSNPNGYRLH